MAKGKQSKPKGSHKGSGGNSRRRDRRKAHRLESLKRRAKAGDERAARMLDFPRTKAGKHSLYKRPPKPKRSYALSYARARRRACLGCFGAASVDNWNIMIQGTQGVPRQKDKEASAKAKQLKHERKPDKGSLEELIVKEAS